WGGNPEGPQGPPLSPQPFLRRANNIGGANWRGAVPASHSVRLASHASQGQSTPRCPTEARRQFGHKICRAAKNLKLETQPDPEETAARLSSLSAVGRA